MPVPLGQTGWAASQYKTALSLSSIWAAYCGWASRWADIEEDFKAKRSRSHGRLILGFLRRLLWLRWLIWRGEVDTTNSTHDFSCERTAFPFALENTDVLPRPTLIHTLTILGVELM